MKDSPRRLLYTAITRAFGASDCGKLEGVLWAADLFSAQADKPVDEQTRESKKFNLMATLTWLDLTSRDRDKMRGVLDLFSEQGTVDEMGLGSLRDALSDALFPGTSSIQTRLRYALFVPWLYQRLEARPVDDVRTAAHEAETGLIEPLATSDDTFGVIGISARKTLSRLPSSVYWASLNRWGIFVPGQSQSWYHTHFAGLARRKSEVLRADDPGVVWTREPTWHPRLPTAPADFPGCASFRLTKEEATFLQGRFEERCTGTLLAWLARAGSSTPAAQFWDDPGTCSAPSAVRRIVELARRFSLHVEGAPLLYNLLLAERRNGGGDDARVDAYRSELARWAAEESAEAAYESPPLWAFLAERGASLSDPQRRFVEAWSERISSSGASAVPDDPFLRNLIEQRELKLKGRRARLANANRLLDWSGSVGVGRMGFRWFRVRQLLTDLHGGLKS